MNFISPAVVIFAVSFVMVIVSELIKWKFFDKEKVDGHQKEMKRKQELMKELIKEGDKRKKEIDKLQEEMLDHTREILGASNKLMFVSLPVFMVLFLVLGMLYGGKMFDALFPLPKFENFFLLNPLSWFSWFRLDWPPVVLTMKTGYYKAYFFSYLVSSIVISILRKSVWQNFKGKMPKLGNKK
ncbi:MAG: EMC3/TMCO1 family protein [Candidatus Diapherotrites archaeon]|nr:EMC3/TMCO1 family protein [Candidatus Diapherotrites archaeon]